jgi:hypothetical protein
MARAPAREDGKTNTGSRRVQGQLHVETHEVPDQPSLLVLDAVADTTGAVTSYYLWVDSSGDLRIDDVKPTDQDGDGAIVGGQS